MLLLADRNFAVKDLAEQIHTTGADLLIRCKTSRRLPAIRRYRDGSFLARLGTVTVRVIDAEITVSTTGGKPHHTGQYRLITTLTDPHRYGALDLITLYHPGRDKLQRITRTAKDPVKLRRAIVVLMSAQGQAVTDIVDLEHAQLQHANAGEVSDTAQVTGLAE